MGTLNQDNEEKVEMDDSGCVEDDLPCKKDDPVGMNGYKGSTELMSLSDDVLLYILQCCSPSDLMALGDTCHRLSNLIQDRTLWLKVPAITKPIGTHSLQWLIDNVLHENTTELRLKGYAELAQGCLGHVRRDDDDGEMENASGDAKPKENDDDDSSESSTAEGSARQPPYPLFRQHARLHINPHQLPRYCGTPNWHEDCKEQSQAETENGTCIGPIFTITPKLLKDLREKCPNLTVLDLQYCNINCAKIKISQFPPTLKKLSLRGTKCFNLVVDKSFVSKIQDYLPDLEEVDLSECQWLEPASLLPLSKLRSLKNLYLAHCPRLTEFVAYASLAARYGFSSLQVLDLSGSPVGDSEVSSVGWCECLQELYCSSDVRAAPKQHSHHISGEGHSEMNVSDEEEAFGPRTGEQVMIEVSLRQRNQPQPEREANNEIQRPERDHNIGNVQLGGPAFNVRISGNNGRNVVIRRNYIGSSRNDDGRIYDGRNDDGRNDDGRNENGRNDDGKSNDSRNVSNNATDGSDDEISSDSEVKTNKRKSDTFNEVIIKKTKQPIEELPGPSGNNNNEIDSDNKTEDNKENSANDEVKDESNKRKLVTNADVVCKRIKKFIEQPSTSKDNNTNETTPENKTTETNKESYNEDRNEINPQRIDQERPAFQNYVRFRQNRNPVILRFPYNSNEEIDMRQLINRNPRVNDVNQVEVNNQGVPDQPGENNQNQGDNNQNQGDNNQNEGENNQNEGGNNQNQGQNNQNQHAEPRHHILYVNVGNQFHHYRLPNNPIFNSIDIRRMRDRPFSPFFSNLHINTSALVSDSSVHMIGRADGDHINYINIGPNFPQVARGNNRPNRSNLRVLSLRGYSNITDRSLVHLATAAPHLRLVDFTRTNVTDKGVEQFKSVRPDCEVIYSPFKKNE